MTDAVALQVAVQLPAPRTGGMSLVRGTHNDRLPYFLPSFGTAPVLAGLLMSWPACGSASVDLAGAPFIGICIGFTGSFGVCPVWSAMLVFSTLYESAVHRWSTYRNDLCPKLLVLV